MISDAAGVGDDQGFTLTGPTATGSEALLELANPQFGESVITLDDASNVTIDNLAVENGVDGVLAIDGSSDLSLSHVTVSDNSADGVRVESGSSVADMGFVTATSNAGYGIYIDGPLVDLHDSTVTDNQNTGIYLVDPGAAIVEANDVSDNQGDGIYVANGGPGTTVIGNADVSQGQGNIVQGNGLDGIEAYNAVSVSGNAVSGGVGSNHSGISVSYGASATSNVVFDNATGIDASQAGNLTGNRVYANSGDGIYSYYSASIQMNVVYSNLIGIQTIGSTSQTEISNNLVYANADDGLLLEAHAAPYTLLVQNNTVYEPTGDAVHIDEQSSYVDLVDNILWTFTGYDVSVAGDSQVGFVSDYNDLMTSASGQVGQWQGVPRPDLRSWQGADQTDADSLAVDPLFVNPLGADGYLGYFSPTNDGRDDDFHEQSLYGSFHSGSLAPVIDPSTGAPTLLTPVLTIDANQSPVIDRGDPTVSFENEPLPNGNFVNLGAYGNTAQASLSPSQYVTVTSPSGGQVWPQGQTFNIEWRSQDSNIPNSVTVEIDLLQVGNPTPVLQIADQVPNNGAYPWTIPATLTPASDYLIRVTREDASGLSAVSSQPFSITLPIHIYYVNDGTVLPGDYTTAPGDDANDGLTPATPKASIAAVLASYHLNPGDTILVDEGTYDLSSTIVLDAADSGIVIQGFYDPGDPSRVTLINRGNSSSSAYAFDFEGATNVTLEDLSITGGYYGVNVSNSNGVVVTGDTVFDNVFGVNVTGGNAQITGNNVYDNQYGISVTNSSSSVVSGNTVHDNSYADIYVYGGVTVSDNTVYGLRGTYGIQSGGLDRIVGNVVHDISGTGIVAGNQSIVEDNQVYDNTGDGIFANGDDQFFSVTITGNHVYANNIGIDLIAWANGLVSNNVVEGNTAVGLHAAAALFESNNPLQFVNNTVIQETGNAVQIDGGSSGVQLLNNILWAQSGYDISVAPDSEVGLQSDYNDLYTTGTGQIGLWEGRSFADLADWYYELGLDPHSLTSDPQFVNPAGPDGVLGYSAAPVGSPQIIDSSSASGFSTSGSWTTNSGAGYEGSYLTAPAGDGSTTASWTFSGLTPGDTYQVAVTWPGNDYPQGAFDAPFTVLDGNRPIGFQQINEESTPTSLTSNGTAFQLLGSFQITGTTLTVVLSNEASGIVQADAVWLQQIVGDHGADDNFHILPNSPAVDAGDPSSPFLEEPVPNGGRVDMGAFGNTSQANLSPPQLVQVLSPTTGLEKYQVGQQVTITWQTDGLTLERPVALIDTGGGPVDNFSQDLYRTDGGTGTVTTTNPIDVSGMTDSAPQGVYQSEAQANYGAGNALSYHLAVPDGVYTVQLDFAELQNLQAGDRVFDIQLQGSTELAGYDIVADAGADFKATAQKFTVTASGGVGINLSLINDTYTPAVLAGLEVYAANPNGVANPTVHLDLSADGGATWTSIATGATMDQFGRGSYQWTIPTTLTPGNQYLVRVTADEGTEPAGVSTQPFLIANSGNSYYINDGSTVGDVFTTAPGNNANSGKSPDQPMASLTALLAVYTLHPGDVIYVDTGTYNLTTNVVLGPQDSGITIEGPSSDGAVFNRGNSSSSAYAFDFEGATNVTLEDLSITGGYYGVNVSTGAGSSGLTVANSTLFDNQSAGAYIGSGNDHVTLLDDTIYGQPSSTALSQPTGLDIEDGTAQLIGNNIYASTVGIYAPTSGVQISGNTIHDNFSYGIEATGAIISGNTVFGQILANAIGIYATDSEIISNVVYTNNYGIYDFTGNTIEQDRLYNNSVAIFTYDSEFFGFDSTLIEANEIYSNSIGIQANYAYTGIIADNLIYANSTDAIAIQTNSSYFIPGPEIANNTIYQLVGNGVSLTGGPRDVSLVNNIIWVFDGYDVTVDSASETGLTSEYNDLYTSGDANANVGLWGGTVEKSLLDWENATGLDVVGTISVDPQFVDPSGADDVLGYALVNGAFHDGGEDDNFYLSQGSLAIDSGESWAVPRLDNQGFGRVDDPGTPNTGSPDYAMTSSAASTFAQVGTAQNWQGNSENLFTLTLPFAFPFYGQSYTTAYVSPGGFLQFSGSDTTGGLTGLINNVRIAPLSDALDTNGPGDDIFVDTSVADQITIRWQATVDADESPANFSVTLFSNGGFEFDYGTGNANLNPTVGFSMGNGLTYQTISGYNGATSLASANSLTFGLEPGFTDMGAFEFQGSSTDNTPPRIVGTNPAGIESGGQISGTNPIQLLFSKPLNPFDAQSAAEFELDEYYGTPNQTILSVVPQYTLGTTTITLNIVGLPNGILPPGNYRLIVHPIHDLSGNGLDGEDNGTAGEDYVRYFTVNAPPTIAAPPSVSVDEDGILAFSDGNAISVADPSGTLEQLTLSVSYGNLSLANTSGLTIVSGTNGSPTLTVSGTLSDLNTDLAGLTYTPESGYSGSDTLSLSNENTADSLIGMASVAITVDPLPALQAPSSVTVNDNSSLTFSGGSAISVTDMAGSGNDNETLTLSVSQGTLSLGTMTGLTVSGTGTVASPLSLSGTLSALNADLPALVYTPASGYSGLDQLSLSILDTTDEAQGAAAQVSITVNLILNQPSVTNATTTDNTQTTSGLVITPNAADTAFVTNFQITNITGGTLYLNDGVTQLTNGEFISVVQGAAGLKFTPTTNSLTSGSFTVQESTSATTAGLGGTTATATITVNLVLHQPSVTNATTMDNTQTTSGLVISPNAADTGFVTDFQITNISGGTLFLNDGVTPISNGQFITVAQGAAGLKFTPAANSLTPGSFTVQESTSATTAGLGGSTATATIAVNLVLHQPSVTNGTTTDNTQTTSGLVITPNAADTGFVTNFQITGISGGTLYENDGVTQISNGQFITVAQGAAGLKFTPVANSLTSGSFTVQESTSATTAGLGGTTTTATIAVNLVLHQPSATNATTTDNTQTTSGLVITPNAADTSFVTNFQITGITGGTLYLNDGVTQVTSGEFITVAQGASGLKFTPAANSLTSGSFTVEESTSATTAGLGVTSATATIAVNLVLHQPSVTNATTTDNTQTTSGLVITPNSADTGFVTDFQITDITGGTLYENDGVTQVTNGEFITVAQGAAGLKFTPATNSLTSGSFTVQESTSATTAGLGGTTATATIAVNLVLHQPSVTNATTTDNTQTTSGLVITPNAADTGFVTNFQITNITGGTLYLNDGVTQVTNGEFITVAQGAAGLKFTPATNSLTSGSFTVQESTSATAADSAARRPRRPSRSTSCCISPRVTNATTTENTQTTSGLVITPNAADTAFVTNFQITNITGGTLYLNDGVTQITNGEFITVAQGAAGLKFTPTTNSLTSGSFTVQESTSATTAGLGGTTATATITVNLVLHQPSRDQRHDDRQHADDLGSGDHAQRGRYGLRDRLPDHEHHRRHAVPQRRGDPGHQRRVHHGGPGGRRAEVHSGGELTDLRQLHRPGVDQRHDGGPRRSDRHRDHHGQPGPASALRDQRHDHGQHADDLRPGDHAQCGRHGLRDQLPDHEHHRRYAVPQ